MYSANLTIQGSGSLTVNVPSGKDGIADGSWSDTAGGTLIAPPDAKAGAGMMLTAILTARTMLIKRFFI